MPTPPHRVAAGAPANARQHAFNPDPFAIVRIEDRDQIARAVADAIATYQPINSQERSAVECIALAKHSMIRMYAIEAGFFTNCLDTAMAGPADPNILSRSALGDGIDIPLGQHRAHWIAFGFNIYTRQSKIASTFLRFQAQAERLHRRAIEDFHRLLKLRDVLPPEQCEEPNEPAIEPIPAPQYTEDTVPPVPEPPISQPPNGPDAELPSAPQYTEDTAPPAPEPLISHPPNEPTAELPPAPPTPPREEPHPARPVPIPGKQPARPPAAGTTAHRRHAAKSRDSP
jgi:hypothetical protein